MKHGVALVLAAVLIAAIAPSASAQQYYGDGTFYGNNGWAGSCAGNIGGWFPGTWPPAGSYLTSLQPGASTPVNVALNGPMYSTAMCGKLLYIKATGEDAGCKTCGLTPIPDQYMLARVTNVCPECLHGSIDFGVQGDGRWKIEWHWADAGTVTQASGKASRAKIVVPAKKSRHSLAYWVHLNAAKLRKAARRAAKKLAAAKRAAARRAKQRLAAAKRAAAIIAAAKRQGRKLLAEELPFQQLPI